MLSSTCCSFPLLAIGFLTVSAKDLDFPDLTQDLTGNGLPLGGSSVGDLSFEDGLLGDSSSSDLSLDNLPSGRNDPSLGFNDFNGNGDLPFPDGKAGTDNLNVRFKDGYDDFLEPITSTIHTTTTICPIAKTHKPTAEVVLPDSSLDFPDGKDPYLSIPDVKDPNQLFPDGKDPNLSFRDGKDSDLPFADGTDDNSLFSDGIGDNLQLPDGKNTQDSLLGSDLDFPDGKDTLSQHDGLLPVADSNLPHDRSQQVTVTVTVREPQPTSACCHAVAPPSNELGNVCKQMMAICAPYLGGGIAGLAF